MHFDRQTGAEGEHVGGGRGTLGGQPHQELPVQAQRQNRLSEGPRRHGDVVQVRPRSGT